MTATAELTPRATSTLLSIEQLFPTSTPPIVSDQCPNFNFNQNNLDPNWVAACHHCLDDFPTLPISTQPFDTPIFRTFTPTPFIPTEEPTFTPSPTPPTETPTPSPTNTPASSYEVFFDFTQSDGGWFALPHPVGGLDNGVYLPGVGWSYVDQQTGTSPVTFSRSVDISYDLTPGTTITAVEFTAVRVPGGMQFANPTAYIARNGSVLFSTTSQWSGAATWSWSGSQGGTNRVTVSGRSSLQNNINNLSGSIVITSALIRAIQPVPTPTLTPTFTPSPTLDATSTSIPSPTAPFNPRIGPQANCEIPQYVNPDEPGNPPPPAVEFGYIDGGTSCFTFIPLIDQQLGDVHIFVPEVILCVHFYDFLFVVGELVIDIGALGAAALAVYLVRWALFN